MKLSLNGCKTLESMCQTFQKWADLFLIKHSISHEDLLCFTLFYVLFKTRRGRFHSVRAGKHVSHEKCDREWRQHATDDSNESNCTSPGRLVDGAGLVTSQGEDYIFRRSELATERISLYSCTKSSALKPSMFSRKILDFIRKNECFDCFKT